MKTFSEFISNIDPAFLEGFEKKDDKKTEKKMPPWLLKGKKGEKCEEKCDKTEKSEKSSKSNDSDESEDSDDTVKKPAKKNPFLKGKKD